MNYYLLLGIPHDADADTIRSAFRTLARRYHPDAGEGSSAERFREVLAAYETLNDPTRRLRYDRTLRNASPSLAQYVEPLRAHTVPEPMLRPSTRVVRTNSISEPLDPDRVEQLIEELFESWNEVFFGVPRRRDRA
jgi:curved DNA-binding protein CbpA